MVQIKRLQLMPGVYLSAVTTDRFASNLIGFQILSPLREDTVTTNALLPYLLRSGNAQYPDMEQLSAALDRLYGARIEPYIRKLGENTALGFVCDTIGDKLTLDGEQLTKQLIALLCSLFTDPLLKDGAFAAEYVETEKQKLRERITAEINEKRIYANKQMVKTMCAGEPYALSEFGTLAAVDQITPQAAYARLEMLLKEGQIELFFCGDADAATIEGYFLEALSNLPRSAAAFVPTKVAVKHDTIKEKTEALDVAQAKLVMGFYTGITASDRRFPALMMANTVFGAGTTSKLFLNVREKLSLCYYASATLDRCKGIMMVSSGIDEKDFAAARDEILRQLNAVQEGDITAEEFDGGKATVLSALRGAADSPAQIEHFNLQQIASNSGMDLDHLIEAIEAVTVADVQAVAKEITLDTIYLLKGRA